MRYEKGTIQISAARDVPLLQQVLRSDSQKVIRPVSSCSLQSIGTLAGKGLITGCGVAGAWTDREASGVWDGLQVYVIS